MSEPQIIVEYDCIGNWKKPDDCLEYTQKIGGVCGLASIAGLLDKRVIDIFNSWSKKPEDFRHFTSQKEMKQIFFTLGFEAKQKSIGKQKIAIPDIDFGIIRVSFGEQNQHWMLTAKNSHYIAIRKMPDGRRYIFNEIIFNPHETKEND